MSQFQIKLGASANYNVSVLNESSVNIYTGTSPITIGSTLVSLPYNGSTDGTIHNYKVKLVNTLTSQVSILAFAHQCGTPSTTNMNRLNFAYTQEPKANLSGGTYNPSAKFGSYAWKGRQPLVYDAGGYMIGNGLASTVDLTTLGFSTISRRTYGTYVSIWDSVLPRAKRHTEMGGEIISGGGAYTATKYYLDTTAICTTGVDDRANLQNPWFMANDLTVSNANSVYYGSDSFTLSLNDENYNLNLKDSSIIEKRQCFEGGKYKHISMGGTDATWKNVPDNVFVILYRKQRADWWKQFWDIFKARNSGVDVHLVEGFCAKQSVVSTPTYLSLEATSLNGVPSKDWTEYGNNGSSMGDLFSHSGGTQVYCGEYTLPIDPTDPIILLDLLGQIQALKRAISKPAQLHVKPFRENITGRGTDDFGNNNTGDLSSGTAVGNCTNCFFKAGSKQVAGGMILLGLFTNTSLIIWGTTQHAELNQTNDHYFGATKVASLISFSFDGTETYLQPEVSFDSQATWIGDSASYDNAWNPSNSNRYTAWTIINAQNSTVGKPIILAVRKANKVALYATIIGGADSGTTTFDFRIARGDGSYYTKPLTLNNRENYVWEITDITLV